MVLPNQLNREKIWPCAVPTSKYLHPALCAFPELFLWSEVAYPVMQGIDITCEHICLTEEISWVTAEFLEDFQKGKVDEFPVSSVTDLCSLDP